MPFTRDIGTRGVMQVIHQHVQLDPERNHHGLEIGCFEGLTTVTMLEFLNGQSERPGGAKVVCIDPFLDRYLVDSDPDDKSRAYFRGQKERFRENVLSVQHQLEVYQSTILMPPDCGARRW